MVKGALVGLISLGILSFSPVRAEEKPDMCVLLAKLAESIMTARQSGVPMTQSMGIAEKADETLRPLLIKLTIAAYDVPQYSVEKNQQREILDFQNQVALQCYQTMN